MSDDDASMIIPRSSYVIPNVSDDYFCVGGDVASRHNFVNELLQQPCPKRIAYLVKNECVVERCEYRKNAAICFRKMSAEKLRSVRVRYDINQVIYARMVDETRVVDYVVISGYENFTFVEVESGRKLEIQTNNFRIQRVFAADRGILIERYRVKGEVANEDEDERLHVFSLMHPNGEIMPVLYQDLGAGYTNYAFPDSSLTLLPSPTENRHNLFLAYDTGNERHLILALRKASKTEQADAYRLKSAQNSRINSAASSFRTTPRNITTHSGPSGDTPLRRSLRNRIRQMSGTEQSPLHLHSRHSSFVSSTRTLAMSMRSQKSVVSTFPDTLCNFNLDGEILEEPEADFTLVCVWQEPPMKSMTIPSSVTPPSGIATSTPLSKPLGASTPKKANMSGTPKGILVTPIAGASRRETATPKRNVSFTSTPLTHMYDRTTPTAAGASSSTVLPHKRPNLQYTPIAKLGFSDSARSDRMEVDDQVNVDLANFHTLPNALALSAVNELIKRQRRKILDAFKKYDFTLEHPENKSETAQAENPDAASKNSENPDAPAPRQNRRNQELEYSQLLKAKLNVLRYYNRNVQWGLRRRFKPINALFALLIYRRELQRAVITDIKTKSALFLKKRIATRFFVTTDIFGHVFAAFLPGGSNKLKLIRWNAEQKPLAVSATNIDAFDAVPVYGNRMFVVLRPNRDSIHLYTGANDLNAVHIKGILRTENKILQLVEGREHTVNLKIQTVKRDLTHVYSYDVGPNWSEPIKKFFDAVSSTLPAQKAVTFFSKWYELSHKNYTEGNRCIDSLLTEYPVILNYFYCCLGFTVDFECTRFITECLMTPEQRSQKRGRRDSAAILGQSGDEEIVFRVSYVQQKVDLSAHVFAVFHIFHMMFESFSFYPACSQYEALFIEPLFVFAKLTNLEKYVEYYVSRQPNLRNARIESPNDNLYLPLVSDAKSFHEDSVTTYRGFVDSLVKDSHAPNIPRSSHWPQAILLCAAIAVDKVNNMQTLRNAVGNAWQKRFNLLTAEIKKIDDIMNSSAKPTEKCFKMMRILRLSICDIVELNPEVSNLFRDVVHYANMRIYRDHESRRNLKEFPTKSDIVRMQRLQWPMDLRAVNVRQMLDASKQILLSINPDGAPLSRDQCENFIHTTFWKQAAKSFGRGAMDLKTVVPSKMGLSVMPKFERDGRVPPTNAVFPFATNASNPLHNPIIKSEDWAYYFHGVAHTLSFAKVPDIPNVTLKTLQKWLEQTQEHEFTIAGAVLGFGLSNLFHNFNYNDVHDMATLKPETPLPGSTLMAIAASNRGTCEMTFFRVISTFLPFYTEPTNIGLKISPFSQVSALLSLGLLFEGTCNQSMTNLLIDEMAKETVFGFGDEGTVSRYSYILCCGVAIGLINLGQGVKLRKAEVPTLGSNFDIDERLELLLTGAPRMKVTSFGRANKNVCPVQAIDLASMNSPSGMKIISTGSMYDFTTMHSLGNFRDGQSGPFPETNRKTANVATGHLARESSTVRETTKINVHVTSPAACLALTLKYLRTNDPHIINVLSCPHEIPLLEKIPPHTIMLRVLGIMLIRWDDIPRTCKAIDDYMPKEVCKTMLRPPLIPSTSKRPGAPPPPHPDDVELKDVDLTTVAEVWMFYRTGCAIALGVRYASTFDTEVYATLMSIYQQLICTDKYYPFEYMLRHPARLTCISWVMMAMSLVMAGSGHLDTLKLARRMRNFITEDALFMVTPWDYQIHTLCNMSMGFLFLGNSRHGIGGRLADTAMLLLSIYPIISKAPADNAFYFQPMRFLYSLASEERHLVPVDSFTHTEIRMNAEVTFKDRHRVVVQLPGVIPPLDLIEKLVLKARDYERLTIELGDTNGKPRKKLDKIFREYHGRYPIKKDIKSYIAILDAEPEFSSKNMQDLNNPRLRLPPEIESMRR